MPDHVHPIVTGFAETSDAKSFIKAATQYSGCYFEQTVGEHLWQRYGYERVIRDDMELALTIGYIVSNPVSAGLVGHPSKQPFLGSQLYTVSELLEMCEYRDEWAGAGGRSSESAPEERPPEGGSHRSV